eukprot:1156435-Pelagomonas_calceolata.AAC.8
MPENCFVPYCGRFGPIFIPYCGKHLSLKRVWVVVPVHGCPCPTHVPVPFGSITLAIYNRLVIGLKYVCVASLTVECESFVELLLSSVSLRVPLERIKANDWHENVIYGVRMCNLATLLTSNLPCDAKQLYFMSSAATPLADAALILY